MKMDREKEAEEYSKEQQQYDVKDYESPEKRAARRIEMAKGESPGSEIILFIAGIFLLIGAFVVAAIGLVAWTILSAIMGSLFVFLGYVMPELRGYIYSHVHDEKKD
jgi:hypothetical protein